MKYASREVRKELNAGKVVKIASATISIGTRASTDVKVRLLDTCGNCSSRSLRNANRAMSLISSQWRRFKGRGVRTDLICVIGERRSFPGKLLIDFTVSDLPFNH